MEKQLWEYKRDCHRLLAQIWGEHKQGRSQAYIWLDNKFGKTIHFSEVNDLLLLKEIHDALFIKSILDNNKPALDLVHKEYREKDFRRKKFMRKKRRPSRNWKDSRNSGADW